MEEEAVRCDVLPSQDALLAVPPALCAPQGLPTPPGLIQHAGWETRPSKAMSYIWIHVRHGGCKHPVPEVQPMASLSVMVLTSQSLPEAFSLLPRNELGATVGL